jgi:hypothetical protein
VSPCPAAGRAEGFSGRELAKVAARVQAVAGRCTMKSNITFVDMTVLGFDF